jgi:hypothetical protein
MPKSPSRKTASLEVAMADGSQGAGVDASPTRKAKAQMRARTVFDGDRFVLKEGMDLSL